MTKDSKDCLRARMIQEVDKYIELVEFYKEETIALTIHVRRQELTGIRIEINQAVRNN
jgi:hypothetical protein